MALYKCCIIIIIIIIIIIMLFVRVEVQAFVVRLKCVVGI